MLIISDFFDYYDKVQTVIDKSITYKRKEEEFIVEKENFDEFLWKVFNSHFVRHGWEETKEKRFKVTYYVSYVLFCGKVYLCINKYIQDTIAGRTEHFFPSSFNDLESSCGGEEKPQPVMRKRFRRKRNEWTKKYLEALEITKKDFSEYHRKYKSPILHIKISKVQSAEPIKIVVNPCLKDLSFMAAVDPYTAYQEIYMYLDGVLSTRKENEMEKISDVDMRDAKGFDDRSFKKQPTKQR